MWIAFKLFNFDTLKTAWLTGETTNTVLWIAFKLFNFDTLKTAYIRPNDSPEGCELLSNFLTLILWKQRLEELMSYELSCELLSNFLTLILWKQHEVEPYHWLSSCELLSNFLTLILWKQQSLSNKLIYNYLMAVFRIKNPIGISDFFVVYIHILRLE